MTILTPSRITGQVTGLLVNPDLADKSIETRPVDRVDVTFEGFAGERHSGLFTKSDVRYLKQYEKDTPIRNTRQVTILSAEELRDIATALNIAEVKPDWLGGNLVIEGIPDLTLLMPSSRLIFSSGAALVVDNENQPCRYPAAVIEDHHEGAGDRFVAAATGKRGVVAWAEREGAIALGDKVALHLPPVRLYPHG